jgi:hypothetical protein
MGHSGKFFDPRSQPLRYEARRYILQRVCEGYTRIMPDVRLHLVIRKLSRIGFLSALAALALGASGCWEELALQYAPVALQTSVGLASAAAGAAESTGGGQAPGVIELRKDVSGSTEYREMRVSFTSTDVHWTPVSSNETAADGWRPAQHLLELNFSPPLPPKLDEARITYLAYAPLYEHASDEDEVKLKEFNRSFGYPVGTFNWNGHTYQYSLPQVLPPLEFD